MKTLIPATGLIVANSGVTLLARILGQNGNPITVASLSTIQYAIRNLTLGTTPTALTSAGTVASLVSNDLVQNDPRWSIDSADNPGEDGRWGRNFLLTLAASLFTSARTFTVESAAPYRVTPYHLQVSVVFTPVSGEQWHIPYPFLSYPTWE